ncbi:GntR family transcriptional regulator [[Clostridium] innocuum]|nr:GntR family transcriptional regulator [[Clostridium] innocuum]
MMTSWEPVVDYLLENMQKQTYKKDERLPSEHELAQRFELTRIEVRKAYDRLKEMGYVYSRQGKGNYYAGYLEKVELVLSSTDSFSMKMSPLAGRFSTRLLSCERIAWHKDIHERLAVVQGEPVLCVKRLRYLDHMPAAMHISYVREKSFPNIRECLQKNPSLYAYFQGRGIQDIAAEDTQLTISTLNTEERLYMKVSGIVPCLMLKGVSRNCKTKEILELSTIIYRGDKFIFRL